MLSGFVSMGWIGVVEILFWIFSGIILYVYAGYPLLLAAIAWRSKPPKHDDNFFPKISLVIAAHNEEKVLREKLENSLKIDYPKDRLEIVVASDGSTDATNAIARTFAAQGVVLIEVVPRGGKARALNTAIPKTHGEILVLSDANTMYQPDALRKLARHFVDPSVGAVSGDVRLVDAADSHSYSEGVYYRYERWLQSLESRLGCIIGADGAMYALRRETFRPPSTGIILDDFVISMTVARLGFRTLYEPEAIAIEQGTLTSREEFRRKVRIVAGGMQALKLREGLPRWQQPFLMLCYLSHKLLRWLLPCFLLLLFVTSAALVYNPFFLAILLGQLLFYGIAVGYGLHIKILRQRRLCAISYYFCLVNGAAFIGIWKGIWGTQGALWQRATR